MVIKNKKIPNTWDLKRIGDLGEIVTGSTPNTNVDEYWNGDIPFVSPTDMKGTRYIKNTERTVTYKGAQVGRIIPKNSVMVTCIASIGKLAISSQECITNQQINTIIPYKDYNHEFLYYAISNQIPYLQTLAGTTAVPIINKKTFSNVSIPVPPINEQRKIAAILSSVDEAIEKTEAIIEQTEKVKKGLMQQLLTKGIGHTKFKKTEIGEIPEEWEVRSIDEIAFVNPEALSNKTDNNYEFEYIDISSIEKPGKIGKTARYKFKDAPSRARRLVRTGDTIVSTVRPYLKGFAFIDKEHDGRVCSTGFAVLRPKASIDPLFLFQSILLNNFVEFLKSRMTGSNYPAVTASDIKEYKFGVPTDINEQKEIAKILSIYDRKLGVEEATLIQLTNLKKSLMQSLLTGKVRVKVDDEVVSS
jgi:type I restriction enzyme, S subunit